MIVVKMREKALIKLIMIAWYLHLHTPIKYSSNGDIQKKAIFALVKGAIFYTFTDLYD